jgi:hypothetical protein
MGGYQTKPAQQTSPGAEQRTEVIAVRSDGSATAGAELMGSPKTAGLLQLRAALDRSPRVRAQVALQRALDQRVATETAPAKINSAREKPALQMKGIAINDDAGLERAADVMGARASAKPAPAADASAFAPAIQAGGQAAVIQRDETDDKKDTKSAAPQTAQSAAPKGAAIVPPAAPAPTKASAAAPAPVTSTAAPPSGTDVTGGGETVDLSKLTLDQLKRLRLREDLKQGDSVKVNEKIDNFNEEALRERLDTEGFMINDVIGELTGGIDAEKPRIAEWTNKISIGKRKSGEDIFRPELKPGLQPDQLENLIGVLDRVVPARTVRQDYVTRTDEKHETAIDVEKDLREKALAALPAARIAKRDADAKKDAEDKKNAEEKKRQNQALAESAAKRTAANRKRKDRAKAKNKEQKDTKAAEPEAEQTRDTAAPAPKFDIEDTTASAPESSTKSSMSVAWSDASTGAGAGRGQAGGAGADVKGKEDKTHTRSAAPGGGASQSQKPALGGAGGGKAALAPTKAAAEKRTEDTTTEATSATAPAETSWTRLAAGAAVTGLAFAGGLAAYWYS